MEDRQTRWVLTFADDGKAILTTTERIERETYEHVVEMWKRWTAVDGEIMVIGDCRIERVGRFELDISTDAIIVRPKAAA